MIAKHSNTEGSYPGHIKKFLQNNKNKADNPAEKQATSLKISYMLYLNRSNSNLWFVFKLSTTY